MGNRKPGINVSVKMVILNNQIIRILIINVCNVICIVKLVLVFKKFDFMTIFFK